MMSEDCLRCCSLSIARHARPLMKQREFATWDINEKSICQYLFRGLWDSKPPIFQCHKWCLRSVLVVADCQFQHMQAHWWSTECLLLETINEKSNCQDLFWGLWDSKRLYPGETLQIEHCICYFGVSGDEMKAHTRCCILSIVRYASPLMKQRVFATWDINEKSICPGLFSEMWNSKR